MEKVDPPPCRGVPADAISYLRKPFNSQEFVARISDLLPGD